MKKSVLAILLLFLSISAFSQDNWEEDLGIKIDEILDSFPEAIDQFSMSILPDSQKEEGNNRQYMARVTSERLYLPYSLALTASVWVSGRQYIAPEERYSGKDMEKESKKKKRHQLFNPQSLRIMVTLQDPKTGKEVRQHLMMKVVTYQLWILDNPHVAWDKLVKKKILQPVFKNDLGVIYSYLKKDGIGAIYYHLTGKGFLFSSPDIEAVKEMMAVGSGVKQSLASVQKVKDVLAVSEYQKTLNLAFTLRAGERVRYETAVALGATKECVEALKINADRQIVPTFSYLKVHDLKKKKATMYEFYNFESSSLASDFFKKLSLQIGQSSVKQKGKMYDPKANEKRVEKKGNMVILKKPLSGKPPAKKK